MTWTNIRIERLKEAWTKDGLSARQIAEEFQDVTRLSVIGKLDRLGLSGKGARRQGVQVAKTRQRRTPAKPNHFRHARPADEPAPSAQRDERPLRTAPVEPLHLSLVDLTDTTCRYPYGVGPFTFCGHPALAERPYCAAHAAICFNGPSARS